MEERDLGLIDNSGRLAVGRVVDPGEETARLSPFGRRVLLFLVMLLACSTTSGASTLVLQAELLSPQRVIVAEPVFFRLTVTNIGREDIYLPFPPDDMRVRTVDLVGPGGQSLTYCGGTRSGPGTYDSLKLAPGEKLSRLYVLNFDYDITAPGAYSASFGYATQVYEDISQRKAPPTWTGRLDAPPLQFSVEPLPVDEVAAHKAVSAFREHREAVVALAPPGVEESFLAKHPRSRFAPYVRYSLAERYARTNLTAKALEQYRILAADASFALGRVCGERAAELKSQVKPEASEGSRSPSE